MPKHSVMLISRQICAIGTSPDIKDIKTKVKVEATA
jgi:hypothetical protein